MKPSHIILISSMGLVLSACSVQPTQPEASLAGAQPVAKNEAIITTSDAPP